MRTCVVVKALQTIEDAIANSARGLQSLDLFPPQPPPRYLYSRKLWCE